MGESTSITRRSFLIGSAAAAAAVATGGIWGAETANGQRPSANSTRPAAPDNSSATTVYSWHDAHQRGIIPMTWQPMQKTGPALFLVRPMPGAFSAPPQEIVAHGPHNIERWRGWMERYYRRFHPGPKWIVLDDESNDINYWSLTRKVPTGEPRLAIFRAIWRDKEAYAKLPDDVKQYKPEDFAYQNNRQAIIAWQAFVGQMKNDALRRVVYEPAVEVFGQGIAVSNYEDMMTDFPVYDLNGWPVGGGSIMGNWSSPSCYLGGGQRYRNRKKAAHWNRFIDCLNYVRSCLNRSAHVAPWVSYPSFHKSAMDVKALRWLWVELIGHMKATGARTFLYWNPAESTPPGDDALAAQTFAAEAGPIAAGPFEAISLDVDEVRTGGKITRYADWRGYND